MAGARPAHPLPPGQEDVFTADEMERLQFAFSQADTQGRGAVTGASLGIVFRELVRASPRDPLRPSHPPRLPLASTCVLGPWQGLHVTDEDLALVSAEMGLEADREIDFASFVTHIARLRYAAPAEGE